MNKSSSNVSNITCTNIYVMGVAGLEKKKEKEKIYFKK